MNNPKESTPNATLRSRFMDSNMARGESEWWALRHIEEIELKLSALNGELSRLTEENAGWREKADHCLSSHVPELLKLRDVVHAAKEFHKEHKDTCTEDCILMKAIAELEEK
jgi:hypothetical protein